mgnify:FL=1|jgi:hypothetical protein
MTSFNAQRLTMTGRAAFFGFCAVAAIFLIYEHTTHVLGALPYLLLLACPLMHLFMHHGHHGPVDARPAPKTARAATPGSDDHA